MTLTVRFTEEAQQDLQRLYAYILDRDEPDWSTAERALNAIQAAFNSLKHNPLSCRKTINPFLRALIISFGATGYVALFEIEADQTVTVLAIRHQREEDYH